MQPVNGKVKCNGSHGQFPFNRSFWNIQCQIWQLPWNFYNTVIRHTLLLYRILWNNHTAIKVKTNTLLQGCTNIPNMQMPPPNSRCQEGDIKQVPSWGPTNIRCYHTKFTCLDDLGTLLYLHLNFNISLKNTNLMTGSTIWVYILSEYVASGKSK